MSETALVKPAGEPFDERVNRLFRELHRAVQWDRPSILLAVYRSEFVRADAARMLTERLHTIGQSVTPHHVTGNTNDDIPVHLVHHPDRSNTIFFVSGLRWGGGLDRHGAYRALNIRREYLVDSCIRAVFWLTDLEELSLPGYAPDFWAFRHRVVDFLEPPGLEQIQRTAPQLLWSDFSEQGLREHNEYKIALHESLMKDLRRYDELMVLRGTTLYTLARLRQARGEYPRSLALLQDALDIGKQADHARLQSDCYLARGTLHSLCGNYDEAIADFQHVVSLTPDNPQGYISLGNVYQLSGRFDEAMALCFRVLALDSHYASAYTGIGHALRTLRLSTAAIEAYQRAISLDPQDSDTCVSLGNLYRDEERYDEAIASYQQAIARHPGDAHPYKELGDIYIYLGQPDKAAEAYRQAARLEQEYEETSPSTTGQLQYDTYMPYEVGFNALLNQVDSSDPIYNHIVTLGQRLQENIRASRLSGDSDNLRSERSEITFHLNELALAATDQTFNDLCQAHTLQSASSLPPSRDRLAYYEDGLHALLKNLDRSNPRYTEALVYEQRLRENIATNRRVGENYEWQAARSQIVDQLNQLAISELGLSFNDLCRGAALEPAPPLRDVYASYERGVRELQACLGSDHPQYSEALLYEQRLQENIDRSRRFGENRTRESERAEILSQLNNLAVQTAGLSFVDLCRVEPSSGSMQPAGDRFSHYEDGLRGLRERVAAEDENQHSNVLVCEQRLRENIARVRRYGDTYTRQRERAALIGTLSDIIRMTLRRNESFFDLCREAFPEPGNLDSDSPLAAQHLMLQEKRTVLERAFEQHRETIKVLESGKYEADPVRLSQIGQKLAEEYQKWTKTLLTLEAVEKSIRDIHAVVGGVQRGEAAPHTPPGWGE
jgi:tetratricopeptide (TPR) repeat protein